MWLTVVAVKVGRRLKLLSFPLRGNCGPGLLGVRGREALDGFWAHQQCPLWVTELLLTAGDAWRMPAQHPVLRRKRCSPIAPGGLVLPFPGQ